MVPRRWRGRARHTVPHPTRGRHGQRPLPRASVTVAAIAIVAVCPPLPPPPATCSGSGSGSGSDRRLVFPPLMRMDRTAHCAASPLGRNTSKRAVLPPCCRSAPLEACACTPLARLARARLADHTNRATGWRAPRSPQPLQVESLELVATGAARAVEVSATAVERHSRPPPPVSPRERGVQWQRRVNGEAHGA